MAKYSTPSQAHTPGTQVPSAKQWAEVVRLRTLPAAVAPVLVGAAVAFPFSWVGVALSLLAAVVALALQVGCNIANDYSDGIRGTDDDRSGPPRLTASGAVAPHTVKMMAFASFGVAGLAGLAVLALSGQWWMLMLGVAAVLAAWFYTGGSKPYGYLGLGEIFVFIFFGLMATAGTTYVLRGDVPWQGWVLASCVGLIACSLLMVNNIRDIDTDPTHGKMTLAVRLGQTRARVAYGVLLIVPGVLGAATLATYGMGLADVRIFVFAIVMLIGVAVWAVLVKKALEPVIRGAMGHALIPCLKFAGLYELAFALATMAVIASSH
ncbi:1,4-dihydroxy-2-naphthoate polyprenyltransferase [Actinomyces vulturis]|uniref:1,4-dihydroxy-2-naphthoate polyprenyltransferase n=1 Tax=Actinomyces vulturis TaxID=1857645 RepID=UPI000834B0E2|nr:1,4-dihydroxy-2-naphthoate polyprenyltransferase [Actinomyces vulturis]